MFFFLCFLCCFVHLYCLVFLVFSLFSVIFVYILPCGLCIVWHCVLWVLCVLWALCALNTFSVLSTVFFFCHIVFSVFSKFLHACLFFVVLVPSVLCCVLCSVAVFFMFSVFTAYSELCSLRCLCFTVLHSVGLNMFSVCCTAVFSMISTPELWFSVFTVLCCHVLYAVYLCSVLRAACGRQCRKHNKIFYSCATHMVLVNQWTTR